MKTGKSASAKRRLETWGSEIFRPGQSSFVSTSPQGGPQALSRLARNTQDMLENLAHLELLRSIFYPDATKPMRKDVVAIFRK